MKVVLSTVTSRKPFSVETCPLCSIINRIYVIAQYNTTFDLVITIKR